MKVVNRHRKRSQGAQQLYIYNKTPTGKFLKIFIADSFCPSHPLFLQNVVIFKLWYCIKYIFQINHYFVVAIIIRVILFLNFVFLRITQTNFPPIYLSSGAAAAAWAFTEGPRKLRKETALNFFGFLSLYTKTNRTPYIDFFRCY